MYQLFKHRYLLAGCWNRLFILEYTALDSSLIKGLIATITAGIGYSIGEKLFSDKI